MRLWLKVIAIASCLLFTQINTIGVAMAGDEMMNFKIDDSEFADFRRVSTKGGRYEIFASGPIDNGASIRLRTFSSVNHIDFAIVYFDSPGGSLAGGIELGKTIRALGFETGVRSIKFEYGIGPMAICASACSYAFAGGTARFYSDDVGKIGLHQFYSSNDAQISTEDTQFTSGYIVEYLDEMGIQSKAFSIASNSTKDEMTWLTTQEAVDIGLANNGVEPASAEIKLAQGKPYLRLQQGFNDVTSRVLIFCDANDVVLMGGIVTTKEVAKEQSGFFSISYLEFDLQEYQKIPESRGFEINDSTVWIERRIPRERWALLTKSSTIGIWLENGGPLRWGATLNLWQVRPMVENFLENCIA